MKNTIKVVIVIAIMLTGLNVSAQKLGIKAGLNFSNMLEKDNAETYSEDYKSRTGIHLGAVAEIPVTEMFSFEPGLLLSAKGYKVKESGTEDGETYDISQKVNTLYLDVPLSLKANFTLGKIKAYGLMGPYFGLGLSGKFTDEYTYDGETEKVEFDINWGSDSEKDDLKRLDFGWNVGAGVTFNSLQAGLAYGIGLANLAPGSEGSYRVKNRVFSLTVGYYLPLNKN